MVQSPATAFAATWRNSDDQVIGTTYAQTMCWDPILPWRLRIERDGYAAIVPCRKCPGCLEFLRTRLAQRLQRKYGAQKVEAAITDASSWDKRAGARPGNFSRLYFVRIYAPRDQHAAISHRLHRISAGDLEPGFFRLGTTSFGVIARSRQLLSAYLAKRHIDHRVEPILLRRGLRAWRKVTAGMLVTREAYGENVNRWYVHGLPPAERENWDVVKVATYKAYSRWVSPRAWKQGNVTLVPPEVWRMRRIDRKKFFQLMSHAGSPEQATAVAGLVSRITDCLGTRTFGLTAPEGLLSREQTQAWYREMARKKQARTSSPDDPRSLPPELGQGGYTSSDHSKGELLPKILTDEELLAIGPSGKPRWMEREQSRIESLAKEDANRRETARTKLQEALESLREKMTRRK